MGQAKDCAIGLWLLLSYEVKMPLWHGALNSVMPQGEESNRGRETSLRHRLSQELFLKRKL